MSADLGNSNQIRIEHEKKQRVTTPDGLTMVRARSGDLCEVWDLDVPGIMVWIKHYSDKVDPSNTFSGWRVGMGGSPLYDHGYNSLEEALPHVRGVAQMVAGWHLKDAKQKYHAAFEAAKAVGLDMDAL